jgi:hypothetical protein
MRKLGERLIAPRRGENDNPLVPRWLCYVKRKHLCAAHPLLPTGGAIEVDHRIEDRSSLE